MDGFLGRPALPDDMRGERLTAADRPPGFGPEWRPAVVELLSADDQGPPTPMQGFVRVAGEEVEDEVVGLSLPPFLETGHFVTGQVVEVRWGAQTAPIQIIGFGATGMLAAALAHAADRATSVWRIDLLLDGGTAAASFRLYREPDAAAMVRLRARLDRPSAASAATCSEVRALGETNPAPAPVGRHASTGGTDAAAGPKGAGVEPAPRKPRPREWDHEAFLGLGLPPLPKGWKYDVGPHRLEIRADGRCVGHSSVQTVSGDGHWSELPSATLDRMVRLAWQARRDVEARLRDGRLELVGGNKDLTENATVASLRKHTSGNKDLTANAPVASVRKHTVGSVLIATIGWIFVMATIAVGATLVFALCGGFSRV